MSVAIHGKLPRTCRNGSNAFDGGLTTSHLTATGPVEEKCIGL